MLSYALTATRCDLRDPGWGDPGFPQRVLLLPHLQRAIFGVCFAFVFQMARADDSTQDALLIRQEHHCPTVVVLGVVFFLFLFVFFFWSAPVAFRRVALETPESALARPTPHQLSHRVALFLFVGCVVACSGFLLVLFGLRHLGSIWTM